MSDDQILERMHAEIDEALRAFISAHPELRPATDDDQETARLWFSVGFTAGIDWDRRRREIAAQAD